METASWRRLSGTDGVGNLLCIGFGQASRNASFVDLAPLLPMEHAVWELVGSRALDAAATTETAVQVDRWLRELAELPADVRGVLGHCAGASLACVLATELARRGGPAPPVVLLDPVVVTPRVLYWQFAWTADGLAEDLAADVHAAKREADELSRASGVPLEEVAAGLVRHHRRLTGQACAALDLDDEYAGQLVGELSARFDTYLRYLVLAGKAAVDYPTASTVLSDQHEVPSLPTARVVRFDVPEAVLLSRPEVAEAVTEALGLTS